MTSTDEKIEQCWFLYGIRIGRWSLGFLKYHSKGTEASVDFDWQKVMASKYFLGWYHTHPTFSSEPSELDEKTMRSWIRGLGRNLICGILGTDGHKCWYYFRWGNSICHLRLRSYKAAGFVLVDRNRTYDM